MKLSKRFFTLSLAVLVGLAAAGVSAYAQGENLVTLCFRNRTIQVPFYLQSRYTASGATVGPCQVTPTAN